MTVRVKVKFDCLLFQTATDKLRYQD